MYKTINKGLLTIALVAIVTIANAQTSVQDSTKLERLRKVDGVSAVVGNSVILNSDIEKALIEMRQEGLSVKDVKTCLPLERIMENKLYAHHAVIDSVAVNPGELSSTTEAQIQRLLQETGSEERMLKLYKKTSMAEVRQELTELNRNLILSREMQRAITEDVDVSPEEVREFFYGIPEADRPQIGVQLEIAQIVINPEVSDVERQRVIDKLNGFRKDVLENGSSFASKAVLYSEDRSSASDGGKISLKRNDPYVKEFKEAAFSMQEGEISEPFETNFGWHILTVDKIRGEFVDVRHILLFPVITPEQENLAYEEIELIKKRIEEGDLTFEEAAKEFSDQEQTKGLGGRLINPQTGDYKFDLTRTDPDLYVEVQDLKEGEITDIIKDTDRRTRRSSFKIMTVAGRDDAHKADYQKDYLRIKELALTAKKIKEIKRWQNEKIKDTYIKIADEYKSCDFESNWIQK